MGLGLLYTTVMVGILFDFYSNYAYTSFMGCEVSLILGLEINVILYSYFSVR